jgi:hypothetical protein
MAVYGEKNPVLEYLQNILIIMDSNIPIEIQLMLDDF